MKWVKKNHYETNMIMKNSSITYLQLISPDEEVIIGWKEVLQFTVPCPLSGFLKQWKAPESKGIFPHG